MLPPWLASLFLIYSLDVTNLIDRRLGELGGVVENTSYLWNYRRAHGTIYLTATDIASMALGYHHLILVHVLSFRICFNIILILLKISKNMNFNVYFSGLLC